MKGFGKIGRLAAAGCIFGLVGLSACFYSTQVKEPTPLSALSLLHTAKDVITVKVVFNRSPEKTPEQKQYEIELRRVQNLKWYIRLAGGILGLVAVSFAVAGYLREESRKAVAAAVCLGVSCIAFEFVIMAFAVMLLGLFIVAMAS